MFENHSFRVQSGLQPGAERFAATQGQTWHTPVRFRSRRLGRVDDFPVGGGQIEIPVFATSVKAQLAFQEGRRGFGDCAAEIGEVVHIADRIEFALEIPSQVYCREVFPADAIPVSAPQVIPGKIAAIDDSGIVLGQVTQFAAKHQTPLAQITWGQGGIVVGRQIEVYRYRNIKPVQAVLADFWRQ